MNKILTFDNLSRYNDKIQTVIDEKVKQLITDAEEYAKKTEVEADINAAIYNVLNTPI